MGIELVGILYWWKQLCIKGLQLYKLIQVSCFCGSYVLFTFGFGKLALVSDVLCEFILVVSKYTAFGWELFIIARFLLKGGSILENDKLVPGWQFGLAPQADFFPELGIECSPNFFSCLPPFGSRERRLIISTCYDEAHKFQKASSRYSASSIVASASFWRLSSTTIKFTLTLHRLKLDLLLFVRS